QTRPRHCRVLPSSTRRAKTEAFPSSSRRGGAKRRGGGFGRRRPPVRDIVASCPPRRGGQRSNAFPSSSRRGGTKCRGGVVLTPQTTRPRHCRVLPSSTRRAKVKRIPLLVEEGWHEVTGWWVW